jgi:hypothetical protein
LVFQILSLQILSPRWGYKYYRPAGATNVIAPLGLQILSPRWGYKCYRPAGATNVIAPLGLFSLRGFRRRPCGPFWG